MGSERLAQNDFQVFSTHISVAHSNHAIPRRFQGLGPFAVIVSPSCIVVDIPIEFDNDPFAETTEVRDEAVQHVLPPKLQAGCAVRSTFSGSASQAQFARERKSLGPAQASEWIHPLSVPHNSPIHATRIPACGAQKTHLSSPLPRRERGTGGEDRHGEREQGVRTDTERGTGGEDRHGDGDKG